MSNKWDEYIREMDEGISKVADRLSTILPIGYDDAICSLSYLKGDSRGKIFLQELLDAIENDGLLIELYNNYCWLFN